MSNQKNIKIFYDSKCSICSQEINFYRSIAPKNTFVWFDLHSDSSSLKDYGLDYKEALLMLHAIDEKEIVYVGVDAFALIWRNIPRFNLLGIMIKTPLIYQLSKFGYRYFAEWRFKRMRYCNKN